jgi:riboflavin transporter FmnP
MAQRRTRLVFVEGVLVGMVVRFIDTLVVKVGNETMWKEFGLIREFVKSLSIGFVGKELVVKSQLRLVV